MKTVNEMLDYAVDENIITPIGCKLTECHTELGSWSEYARTFVMDAECDLMPSDVQNCTSLEQFLNLMKLRFVADVDFKLDILRRKLEEEKNNG